MAAPRQAAFIAALDQAYSASPQGVKSAGRMCFYQRPGFALSFSQKGGVSRRSFCRRLAEGIYSASLPQNYCRV